MLRLHQVRAQRPAQPVFVDVQVGVGGSPVVRLRRVIGFPTFRTVDGVLLT